MPTHRVNSQAQLRYAVSVDGGPTQIRDIDALELSGEWGLNVLKGYAFDRTEYTLKNTPNHTVTISFLDPGLVLNQVQVFSGDGGK